AGMTATVPFVVCRDDMGRFAEMSGDFNPLHVDESFARSKGFTGVVVYGALIIAKVSQLIGMQLPGRDALWTSVALDFVRPLYVGQHAYVEGVVTHVSAATGMVEMKLKIRTVAVEQVVAKGKAEVLIVH
ncbi:MAG TPA: MaoC/PaaZ C-terminal domain-containing protein, partial [Burkholderiales bacterium]|nr:MaoC/PaaZ C-terminal domain-containing protein [Burkholderiales bacterium]